jgi:quinol monooxygenase YgiN
MNESAHTLRFTVKPGSGDQLMAVFARALPHILEDETTVSWFVGRSETDEESFVLSHAFVSEAAREAHFKGPAATLIMTEGAPFFAAEPKIENLALIAGDKMGD